MKMSQMFKTTLAAAMIMALAVTAGCGGGGDKKSAGSEKVTLKLAHICQRHIRWPREWRLLIKSLLKNPTALLH